MTEIKLRTNSDPAAKDMKCIIHINIMKFNLGCQNTAVNLWSCMIWQCVTRHKGNVRSVNARKPQLQSSLSQLIGHLIDTITKLHITHYTLQLTQLQSSLSQLISHLIDTIQPLKLCFYCWKKCSHHQINVHLFFHLSCRASFVLRFFSWDTK